MLRNNLSTPHVPGDITRRGLSLVEITAALVLIGLLAAVSPRYFTKAASGSVQSSTVAGTLQLLLQQARHQAIRTGESAGLKLERKKGRVTRITPVREVRGRENAVSDPIEIPSNVRVKCKRLKILFDSEGTTSNGASFLIESPERQWLIDVVAVTGAVRLREL